MRSVSINIVRQISSPRMILSGVVWCVMDVGMLHNHDSQPPSPIAMVGFSISIVYICTHTHAHTTYHIPHTTYPHIHISTYAYTYHLPHTQKPTSQPIEIHITYIIYSSKLLSRGNLIILWVLTGRY